MRVETTGARTHFGKIAEELATITEPPTPLQLQLARLGKQFSLGAIAVSALLLIAALLTHQPLIPAVLTAVSLAVAAVPEGLPTVITIALAIGVQRMAKRRAIVRKILAVEGLGSVTTILSDKTGTLTMNEMRVQRLWYGKQEIAAQDRTRLAQEDMQPLWEATVRTCQAELVLKEDGGGFDIFGDPTEGALLRLAAETGISPSAIRSKGKLLHDHPFSAATKIHSIIWQENGNHMLYALGAPEEIILRATRFAAGGRTHPMSGIRETLEATFEQFAAQGLRVIAAAYRELDSEHIPPRDDIEKDLTFLGLFAIADAARPEVTSVIQSAEQAGIRTVMVTGDSALTAKAIAEEIKLIKPGEEVITGAQLERFTDEELLSLFPKVRIFARTMPEQKLRLVRLFQRQNDVIAVTGDGVNDAPALKAADIGLAMGKIGTDVAKEASDIILTDDNYATIVSAIEQGRMIYDNMVRVVRYLIGTNIGEILFILGTAAVGLPVPLLPIHILWINLISDGLPAIALAMQPGDPDVLNRRPRGKNVGILRTAGFGWIIGISITLAVIPLAAFLWAMDGRSLEAARTAGFTAMVLAQMIVVFIISGRKNLYKKWLLVLTVALTLLLQFALLAVPSLRDLFKLTTLW
jgi:Ca2+-transporting ATPase